jgi:hypothetical protein
MRRGVLSSYKLKRHLFSLFFLRLSPTLLYAEAKRLKVYNIYITGATCSRVLTLRSNSDLLHVEIPFSDNLCSDDLPSEKVPDDLADI